MRMRISRRSLLISAAVAALGAAVPRAMAAARPSIIVYKGPT